MSENGHKAIRELAAVLMGQSPPSAACSETGDGLPFIQGNAEFGRRNPVPKLRCAAPTRIAEAGDFLLSVRAPVGELNQSHCRMVIGRGLSALRFEETDRQFAWHSLLAAVANLNRIAQGSTFVAVSRQDVETLQIAWREQDERRYIAAVLDSVDGAIEWTEVAIAKLKHIRFALLFDLLTRGLDNNGELRDPLSNPEHFHTSALGSWPRGWGILKLEQLLAPVRNPLRSGPFGSALLKQELKAVGIPLLGIDNVHVERFESNFVRFVDEDKFVELNRYAVRPQDVMITIMGTVGRCCVVPDSVGRALSSKHVWTITLDQRRYSPYLACWQLNYAPWALRQLRRDEQGGVMSAIRSETIRSLLLPVPPPDEMSEIELAARELANGIEVEERFLRKLRLLKAGLAADLLNGRVLVPENILQEAAS